ncbi:hypothetical protein FN846DRAFT_483169 [Sphaerosporella brunnea]|uniref:Uncharacterized protein n=1 Tax=Sphaerosporella brunnea TaxID=1250544 RepID=A0A5J5FC49_9PEZI|nr:hypothetical protein FN846DRAFT_483169 [Sphaerosporella brunnea]
MANSGFQFLRLLPFNSLREPMLLNAFLACGARHLTLVNPAYKEDKALAVLQYRHRPDPCVGSKSEQRNSRYGDVCNYGHYLERLRNHVRASSATHESHSWCTSIAESVVGMQEPLALVVLVSGLTSPWKY